MRVWRTGCHAAVAVWLGLASAAWGGTELTLSSWVGHKHPINYGGFEPFMAAVEASTEGAITFRFFSGGALLGARTTLDGIRTGIADAGMCLRFLTELEREEIESLDAARTTDAGKRESQRRLAEELTRLIHDDEGLKTAQRATEIFFGAEISQFADAQLSEIFADVSSRELPRSRLDGEGLNVIDALVEPERDPLQTLALRIGSHYIRDGLQ